MMCSFKQIDACCKRVILSILPIKKFLLIISFLTVFIVSQSQRNPFRIYTVEDGLINLQPQAIFQDDDGFMWFGGIEGVSIYDGNHFMNFRSENKGPRMNFLYNFFQKNRNEVWALYSDGIEVFVKRKFKETLPIGGINYMLRTKDQRILAAGRDGIYEFINDKPHVIFPSKNSFDRLFAIGNYFLGCQIPREKCILFDHSFHLIDTLKKQGTFLKSGSNFWWFSDPPGNKISLLDTVAVCEKGRIRLVPAPARIDKIHGSPLSYPFTDSDGFVWVTANKDAIRIGEDGTIRKFHLSNGLGTNFATGYFEDCEGNIWLQTDGYIKFFNKAVDIFSKDEGLSLSPVYSIAEDSCHNIWIAQSDGMSNLKENSIYKFNYPHSVRNGEIVPKIMIRGDSLWLAYYGLWLFKIHYGPKPQIHLEREWLSWHQKKLVFGHELCTYRDGTPLVDFDGDIYRLAKKGGLQRIIAGMGIFRFLVSGDELWSGPLGYGISRWRIIPWQDSLRSQLIRRYDDIPGLRVLSISQDRHGNIWAGTLYKGVIEFEKQSKDSFVMRNYDVQNGLPGNEVNRLFIDRAGNLFVNTSHGFCVLRADHDSMNVENLNDKYGFYGNLWDMDESKNGDLWLAAQTGAVRIRKIEHQKNLPPRIFITGILCNDRPDTSFVVENKIRSFSYKQNNLSFEFTATSFKNEAEVLYSYQLQSGASDSTWSQPKRIHQVSFASLSPGHYTFKVKALSTDNQWSKSPAEYSFIIAPPFYETWWFRAAIILLFIGTVSGLYRYRLSQIRRLWALRTRISRDLHDEIGSALTSINILSKVSSVNLAKDTIKTSQLLEQITEQSQDIQQNMSDIVWAIRPDNDKLGKMAIRMREYLGHTAEANDLKVELQIDEKTMKESLSMQQRKDLFLIFKEAVNNAVKYSAAKKIVVFLGQQDHHIRLFVKDDGIGFNPDNITSSSGLKNMRDRAKDLNGILKIQSSEGEGTSVEFIGLTT